jgi:cyclase
MNRREFIVSTSAAVSLGYFARGSLYGQATPPAAPSGPATEFKELRRGVGLFTGRGGTIGWLSNRDALVAIDTQFPATAEIFAAGVPGREGRSFAAVINTHHHPDHTGGNGILRPMAAKIVAHENVPELMQAAAARNPQGGTPTLPDTTFAESWRMDAGDETISARYHGPAHTRGDIIVHFEKANVVHMGDLMFNRLYPVIDGPGGARVRGWITLLESAARTYPADAIYIFGHGNPKFGVTGTPADLLTFRDYLSALMAHVEAEIAAGKSKAEIITRQNLDGFPDYHVTQNSRLPSNLSVVYDELTGS